MAGKIKSELPQAPDTPYQDAQFPFDGAWLPDQDPALIGPRNFSVLTNLRYSDKSIEGINGYSKINTTALTDYVNIKNGIHFRADKTTKSFALVHAVDPNTGQGRVYQNTTTVGSQGDFDASSRLDISGNAYRADIAQNLTGRFSLAPQNSVAYCNGQESLIYSGFEQRVSGIFLQQDDSTEAYKDISEDLQSSLETSYTAFPDGSYDELILLTTRPAQGFKFYVNTANVVAGTMTVSYWNGTGWTAVGSGVDGTDDPAGTTLGQTGVYSFTHTSTTVKLKHYQELYLYAYKVTLSGGVSADIYQVTYDPAMQAVQNIWDGVYRQPIQFQVFSADHYEDYTLQVNQSSDINTPIGALLDGLLSTDAVYIMFEEQMAAIRFTMLGDLINKNAQTMVVKYWNGSSWNAVSNMIDGTLDSIGGTKTLNKTGTVSWTPGTTEERITLFGTLGYAYQITFTGTLSGTKADDTSDLLVDLCAGIPTLSTVKPFDFPVQFKNRLMLCGFSSGGEGNRIDFSVASAPDVFNGTDSSDGGVQSIYVGGAEPIRGAVQLFNRFGASVFAMLMLFKNTEIYMLVGDTPEDFEIFPVSMSTGCPVPQTICTTEVSMEGGENFTRNFALWVSHSGPMMFDGAIIAPIKGVENYFDPNNADYVNWAAMSTARSWVDPIYKEWNILLPISTATVPNVWLCYDLQRRKWYRKDTGTARTPLCGFNVMDPDTGEQRTYGGLNNGYMMMLEDGTSWDGVGITQVVRTGDIWPTNNIWDLTLLRKFKLVAKRITSSTSYSVSIWYYGDTDADPGQTLSFEDTDASIGVAFDFEDTDDFEWAAALTTTISLTLDVGLQRVVTKNLDMNYLGWAHAFQFEVTTTDVPQGFCPIAWGFEFYVVRKDNTAN